MAIGDETTTSDEHLARQLQRVWGGGGGGRGGVGGWPIDGSATINAPHSQWVAGGRADDQFAALWRSVTVNRDQHHSQWEMGSPHRSS